MSAPYLQDPDVTLYHGDALEVLRGLPSESVHCCVTSPPFYSLRDYGVEGQIGLESTPEEWCAKLVEVFREVRRVLRSDGTCWIELGDSYNNRSVARLSSHQGGLGFESEDLSKSWANLTQEGRTRLSMTHGGMKEKDLIGAPWLLAFALRSDGWFLRSEIIWAKKNCMPESVTDRPTTSHSRIFLLAKSARYFYDAEALREPHNHDGRSSTRVVGQEGSLQHRDGERWPGTGRNARSVWSLPTEPFPEAHFATFPQELVRRCILAGSSERGCCPECGAPWVRVVEETDEYRAWKQRESEGGGWAKRSGDLDKGRGTAGSGTNSSVVPTKATTTGWKPSCGCVGLDDVFHPAALCTVLDPFTGSGTTAFVARKLGRRSIGIDLNADYLAMAAKRLAQQSLLAVEA